MKIGIITDIHEDAIRLSIALKTLEKSNCDIIVCLGDVSGFDKRFYSFQFDKNLQYCIDCINVNCRVIIPGNHDLFHLKMFPQYNSIFDFPENWYDLSFAERKKISNGNIWLYEDDEPILEQKQFNELFIEQKDKEILEIDGFRILFTHSVSPDISGFLTKKPIKLNDFAKQFDYLNSNKCNIGISGHFHPNGLMRIDKQKINKPKFTTMAVPIDEQTQYFCPCIADGVQDNGFTIFDTVEQTIEAFPLRTPKYNSFVL